jgi:hypothetical protein
MSNRRSANFNLDEILHPAHAFGHPSEVVGDPDLTLNEKRAILASWASDAATVEAAPDLRTKSHGSRVRFDDILDALRTLDKQAQGRNFRNLERRRRILRRDGGNRQSGSGAPL